MQAVRGSARYQVYDANRPEYPGDGHLLGCHLWANNTSHTQYLALENRRNIISVRVWFAVKELRVTWLMVA
jgi:hypothetical protein